MRRTRLVHARRLASDAESLGWQTPAERFDGTPFTDRGFEHVPSLAPVAELLAEAPRGVSTDEPLEGAPDLGHGDGQLALGGLDPAETRPVARSGRLGRALVAGPAEEGRDLVFGGPLEDELGTEAPTS